MNQVGNNLLKWGGGEELTRGGARIRGDTVIRDNMEVSVPAGATAEFMTTKEVASILDNPLSRAKEGK